MNLRAVALVWVLASGAALGYGVLLLGDNNFKLAFASFVIGAIVIEIIRQQRRVEWWAAHVFLLSWGLIVLVPWAVAQRAGAWKIRGSWSYGGSQVGLQLPETADFHIIALSGILLGTILALVPKDRSSDHLAPVTISWKPLSAFLATCVAVYLMGFIIAGRPLSAIWRLGGEIRYFDNVDGSTPLKVLDYAPTIGSAALLVGSSVRRQYRRLPSLGETCWLVLYLILAAGTGSRMKIYFLVLGWLIIQISPLDPVTRRHRSAPLQMVIRGLAGAVLLATVIATAQSVSALRARGLGVVEGSVMDRAMVDVDVVGTGELMFIRGAATGMLQGRSYSELPILFLPRRIIGSDKPSHIAADGVMRDFVDRNAGLAAPLWLEPALNFGESAVLLYTVVLSATVVWLLRRGLWSKERRLGAAVSRLGPLWILVSYLTLSRLTTYQMMLTVGTVLAGCYAASKCTLPVPTEDLSEKLATVQARPSVLRIDVAEIRRPVAERPPSPNFRWESRSS